MTETAGTLLRLAAFTTEPGGGNPAGVWIGEALPSAEAMQRIALEVGYSETAFLAPLASDGSAGGPAAGGPTTFRVRYFSPLAEVPFCGHATIASGVALAKGPADLVLLTNGGPVNVRVAIRDDAFAEATLTSIEPWVREADPSLTAAVLELLGWDADDLDPGLPPAIAFAGACHLVLPVRDRARLDGLGYPFEALKQLMLSADLTTLQLIWREAADRFHARDPFPVGGVVEDPATGAAAAAFGAYLRARGEITAPATFEIIQGVAMGRPSRLTVSIVAGEAGVRVSGTAIPI